MRTGKNLLLFANNEEPEEVDETVRREGRNSKLMDMRNELMAARLYWYRNFTDKRDDVIYDLLSIEFFLTPIRIQEVLLEDENMVKLQKLKNERPDTKVFKSRWPHWVW